MSVRFYHLQGGVWVRNDGTSLPLVDAESSDSILDQWGVNLHQSYPITDADGGVYASQNYGAIEDLMVDLGVRIYRDVLKTAGTGNNQRTFYSNVYNNHGMRGSLVMGRRGGAPTYDAQSTTYRNDLASYATANADKFVQMEGYNEPNYVTSGRPSDWDEQVTDHMQWMWNLSASINSSTGVLIPVASASLHNVTATRPQDLLDLAALGWDNFAHRANIHCYPGPQRPSGLAGSNSDIAGRTADHYTSGGFNPNTQPATNTESGYFTSFTNNATDWVPYDIHEIYIIKHLLAWRHLDRKAATPLGVLHQFYYEFLDDPDTTGTDRESNLGLVEVPNKTDPNTWTPKLAFNSMKAFLADMKDVGDPFTPEALPLTVTGDSNVLWRLYGKRNGTYKLVMWKDNQNLWSEAGGYVTVSTSNMTVETPLGTEVVPVSDSVVVHNIGSLATQYRASAGAWSPLGIGTASSGSWT